MVDSSSASQSNVDVNQIATDLNGKADRDLVNLSETGRVTGGGLAFPSSHYDDLTSSLTATGQVFVAPANGWFALTMKMNESSSDTTVRYMRLNNLSNGIISEIEGVKTFVHGIYIPISKGQTCKVTYTATGGVSRFRFIYAEGSSNS